MLPYQDLPEEFNICSFLLDRHLEEGRGNKTAIYYGDEKITYLQVSEEASRIGHALLGLGVERENRIMICLPDCPHFIYCFFGAMKIGAVPVPVSTRALTRDYHYYLNDSRAKVLVIKDDILPKILPIRENLPYLKYIIVVGRPVPETLNYNELTQKAPSRLKTFTTSKDDMAFWYYSSGTTGKPKGVIHLHHDLIYLNAHAREVLSMTEDDIVYSVSKLYFSYGRNNSLDSVFSHGSSVVLNPDHPKPDNAIEIVKKYRPTIFCGVPTFYASILKLIEEKAVEHDFSSVRAFVSAGEPLPQDIYYRWKKIFGKDILDGLGSTDVGAIYMSSIPGQVKPGSVGKLLGSFEGKLVDENGIEVKRGQIGNLWIKCEGTASHYWNKHSKTKNSFFGEWFITNDMFYQDEEGNFYLVGRYDDMLKSGGIWVSPVEVENILHEHPCVRECGVVGALDANKLQKPVAFIVLNEGYSPSPQLKQELRDFVRNKTDHYKCPHEFYFVDNLPRTYNGKLQRCKLRERMYKNVS